MKLLLLSVLYDQPITDAEWASACVGCSTACRYMVDHGLCGVVNRRRREAERLLPILERIA